MLVIPLALVVVAVLESDAATSLSSSTIDR